MPKENHEEIRSIKELIEAGYEIAGSVSGVLIGGAIMGPAGLIIGGASGPILTRLFTKAGKEIKKRILGEREESRIGYTYAVGLYKINSRLERGEQPRNDGFFENDESNRSAGEEILEGVLRIAQNEYQEKKLRYLGNLLANIAFDSSISRDKANLFLKIAQNLTYQQLCILQYVSLNERTQLSWQYNFMRFDELQKYNSLEPAIEGLDSYRLVWVRRYQDTEIDSLHRRKLGHEITKLMELSEIDKNEISLIGDEFLEVKEIIKANKDKYYSK